MIWAIVAVALGLIVLVALGFLTSPLAEQADPAMVWEARVAVGFTALVAVGPFWLAQGIVTAVATFGHAGSGWLWAWFAAAPLLGSSPPAAAAARAVRRALNRRPPVGYSPRGVAAVAQEANFAWAATHAEAGWELRRTPPLPVWWPPEAGGTAVWFCYAERHDVPQTFDVAAPWARITLAAGESGWPVVERLSDAVQPLGVQAVIPLQLSSGPTSPKAMSLLDALYQGDSTGHLEETLRDWRSLNGLIAGHSAVAAHLPPG